MHTEGRLFPGGAPKTINDSVKQTCLMFGVSTRVLAATAGKDRLRGGTHMRTKKGRVIKDPSIFGMMFLQGLQTYGGYPRSLPIEQVEELLNQQAKQAELAADPTNKLLKKEWATTKKLPPIQLRDASKSSLPAEGGTKMEL